MLRYFNLDQSCGPTEPAADWHAASMVEKTDKTYLLSFLPMLTAWFYVWQCRYGGTNIHGAQRMTLNYFDDPQTFLLVQPPGQSFHLSSEIPQHLLDGLAEDFENIIQTFIVPRGCIL